MQMCILQLKKNNNARNGPITYKFYKVRREYYVILKSMKFFSV